MPLRKTLSQLLVPGGNVSVANSREVFEGLRQLQVLQNQEPDEVVLQAAYDIFRKGFWRAWYSLPCIIVPRETQHA